MKLNTVTSAVLYDLVWSKPMTKVAKELSYSDNGLRKICIKHNIPMPRVGYWSKIKFGKKVQKTKPAKKETKVEQAVTAAPQENPVASTPETSVETPPPAPTSIAPVSEEAITAPNSLFSDDI